MGGKSGGGSGLKVTFKNIAKTSGYGGLKPVQAAGTTGGMGNIGTPEVRS
jgi:hypothetical protein